MVPLTPALLVATAVAFAERHGSGGVPCRAVVKRVATEDASEPWCTQLIHHLGFWSHYDHRLGRSSWPLPATGGCARLARIAALLAPVATAPVAGDVFLVRDRDTGHYVHAGIVVAVHGRIPFVDGDFMWSVTTVEAAPSQEQGSCAESPVIEQVRWMSTRDGDRFIHWAQMRVQARAA